MAVLNFDNFQLRMENKHWRGGLFADKRFQNINFQRQQVTYTIEYFMSLHQVEFSQVLCTSLNLPFCPLFFLLVSSLFEEKNHLTQLKPKYRKLGPFFALFSLGKWTVLGWVDWILSWIDRDT